MYLVNSFDFLSNPGMQLHSPEAHCLCPICSWLINAPHLKAKKVRPRDKRRAQAMRVHALLNLVAEHRPTSEAASLLAYGRDLLQRERGIANGPAVLARWRGFAWEESGSPKHHFRLTAEAIVDAEERLLNLLQARD